MGKKPAKEIEKWSDKSEPGESNVKKTWEEESIQEKRKIKQCQRRMRIKKSPIDLAMKTSWVTLEGRQEKFPLNEEIGNQTAERQEEGGYRK